MNEYKVVYTMKNLKGEESTMEYGFDTQEKFNKFFSNMFEGDLRVASGVEYFETLRNIDFSILEVQKDETSYHIRNKINNMEFNFKQVAEVNKLTFKMEDLQKGILNPTCTCGGKITCDYDGEYSEDYYFICECGAKEVLNGYMLDSLLEE